MKIHNFITKSAIKHVKTLKIVQCETKITKCVRFASCTLTQSPRMSTQALRRNHAGTTQTNALRALCVMQTHADVTKCQRRVNAVRTQCVTQTHALRAFASRRQRRCNAADTQSIRIRNAELIVHSKIHIKTLKLFINRYNFLLIFTYLKVP